MDNLFKPKLNDVFNDGCLSQFKKDEGGFNVLTHLDKLNEPYKNNTHILDKFDNKGNFLGTDFNYKLNK